MMGNCLKKSKLDTSETPSNNNPNKKSDLIVSIVGLDDSGKTTTVKVLKSEKDLNDVSPTVGYEPHDIKYNSKTVTLYDLGGSERVRDIWKHYLSESYGFIYVIDCSNRSKISQNRTVFASFLENEKVSGKPVLILGNKQDHLNSLDESEIVQFLNVEELANKFEIPCRVETCYALNGIGSKMDKGIKVGFEWLFKHIIANYEDLKKRVDHDVNKQKSEEMRIRREKTERVRQRREYENPSYEDQNDEEYQKNENPWKRLDEMRMKDMKDSKSKMTTPSPKLSAYERQLIDDMDSTSRSRLSTITEHDKKSKLSSLKSNKLVPLDDKSDIDQHNKSKQNYNWAITDTPLKHKTNLPALSYRSKYDI